MWSQTFEAAHTEDGCSVRFEIAAGRTENQNRDRAEIEYMEYSRNIFKIQQELKKDTGHLK